jgi:hypothetical protein
VNRTALTETASLLVAANWLWAGVWKLTDFAGFRTVVSAHGILSARWTAALPVIPVAECALAVLMVLCCAPRGLGKTWPVVPVVSLAVLVTFTGYLALVSPSTLREVGCGCHAAAIPHLKLLGLVDGRAPWIAFNVAVAILHGPLLFGPPSSIHRSQGRTIPFSPWAEVRGLDLVN